MKRKNNLIVKCGVMGLTAAMAFAGMAPGTVLANDANVLTEYYRSYSFEEQAAVTLSKTGSITIGNSNADGGVAEIVAYNADNQCLYVVNGQDGVLDVATLTAAGELVIQNSIEVKQLIEGFTYGDMTSVSVDTANDSIAIALQAADYKEAGRVAVMDYEGNLKTSYETGVQPDMVTFAKDGAYILTANEGEPREGYGDGVVDPAGSVTIIDTRTGEAVNAGFEGFDSASLANEGVLFSIVNGNIASAAVDLEPEYIAVNAAGTKAYVSLQEANAIGILDLEAKAFTAVKSLGFKDYSLPENVVDLVDDGVYQADNYANVFGVYMPDGVSLYEANGTTYLVTANEGDAREWGSDSTEFVNEAKETLTSVNGTEAKKVRVLDQEVTAGLDSANQYLFGGRSFSIFNADTMELVYDSANQFESKTAAYIPDYFNCSNDDIEFDSRSAKKGPEPETVVVGQVGDKSYAFVALERIGGVMVYDITAPNQTTYVNYINTRSFEADIKEDVAPEGLAFIPAAASASGKPVLLAACEVSGTVVSYTIDTKSNETTEDNNDSDTDNDSDQGNTSDSSTTDTAAAATTSPVTGDTTNAGPVFGMLILSIMVGVICSCNLRKKE